MTGSTEIDDDWSPPTVDELFQMGLGGLRSINVTHLLGSALLEEADGRLRILAAQHLGQRGDLAGLAYLVRALGDSSCRVQVAAVTALGELGDARAAAPLLGALNRSSNSGYRRKIRRALARIGSS